MVDIATLHARNVADVNARLAAEGRCIMHNTDTDIPARYLLELPIGNVLPLCPACCAWWCVEAKDTRDPARQPVRITDIELDLDPN